MYYKKIYSSCAQVLKQHLKYFNIQFYDQVSCYHFFIVFNLSIVTYRIDQLLYFLQCSYSYHIPDTRSVLWPSNFHLHILHKLQILYLHILLCMLKNRTYILNILQWRIQDFRQGAWTRQRGCGPPTRALFAENVCKNERIGSCRGACMRYAPQIR